MWLRVSQSLVDTKVEIVGQKQVVSTKRPGDVAATDHRVRNTRSTRRTPFANVAWGFDLLTEENLHIKDGYGLLSSYSYFTTPVLSAAYSPLCIPWS